MSDSQNNDLRRFVINFVDDAIVTYTDTMPIFRPRKLFNSMWSGVLEAQIFEI